MVKASHLFTDADRQAVETAVTEAEAQTTGEIVPVVATQSGRYDRGEDTFGLVLGVVAVSTVWLLFQDVTPKGDEWGSYTLAVGLGVVLATFVTACVVGAALATRFPALALPFVSRRQRQDAVAQAGQAAFFECGVRGTEASTGILIYVSLLEHTVCVLGDEAIGEKLDQSQWDEIRQLITEGLGRGRAADGLCAGIRRCGELLTEHFPLVGDHVNELGNGLYLID